MMRGIDERSKKIEEEQKRVLGGDKVLILSTSYSKICKG